MSFLVSRKDHPTADVIYAHVKREYPSISLGTVYRNLAQLTDSGIIRRLSFGDADTVHFDADTSPHHHFVCSDCGRVMDLQLEGLPLLDEAAGRHFDGIIQGHTIYFHGLCRECLQK